MGVTLIVLGIIAIVTIATVKEYLKQKDYEKAREEAAALKVVEVFKEEERLVETQPSPLAIENPVDYKTTDPDPAAEAPKKEKPKRKYNTKKKASKPKKATK